MKVTITIDTDNAAFDDGRGGANELSRILRTAADHIVWNPDPDGWPTSLRDSNGNTVGHITTEEN